MSRVSSNTYPCKRCGAPIRWATSEDGQRTPVTPHSVEVVASDDGRRVQAHYPHKCGQPQ